MAVGKAGLSTQWAGGVIPFEINRGDFGRGTPDRLVVEAAINHWNASTTSQLVPRLEARHHDYVVFERAQNSCGSPVGRRGGAQAITCAVGTGFGIGSVVHEIGHAFGLWHEHQRSDRDGFVAVRIGNVREGAAHNFRRRGSTNQLLTTYDFRSIMHYSSTAFARPSLRTIDVGQDSGFVNDDIGQRDGLSRLDIAGIDHRVSLRHPIDCTKQSVFLIHTRDGTLHRLDGHTLRVVDSGDDDWSGLSALAVGGRKLFIVQNAALHRVDAGSVSEIEQVGDDRWDGPVHMVVRGDKIFILQNERLHRVSMRDVSDIEQVGDDRWNGARAIAALSEGIFIVQDDRLHKVNPRDVSDIQQVGDDRWDGAVQLSGSGSALYIVQHDRLHKVNAGDVSDIEQVGDDAWDGTATLLARSDSIYVVQNRALHKVRASDVSDIEQIGNDDWSGPVAASISTGLYILQNDHLHRVDPADVSNIQIAAPGWD